MRTLEKLKELAVKITTATKASDVTGDTIDEVLDYIVKNFQITTEAGK